MLNHDVVKIKFMKKRQFSDECKYHFRGKKSFFGFMAVQIQATYKETEGAAYI